MKKFTFNFGKSRLAQLKEASENALSTFTKALNDLETINHSISEEAVATQDNIDILQQTLSDLKFQKASNSKIIDNIKRIIN